MRPSEVMMLLAILMATFAFGWRARELTQAPPLAVVSEHAPGIGHGPCFEDGHLMLRAYDDQTWHCLYVD